MLHGKGLDGGPEPVTVTNGKLDVNATVTTTGADGSILDGATPTIKATVKQLADSNPICVAIVDSNGDQVAGSAVSIADNGDINAGAKADTAVTGDNSGTLSAKIRGLNKIWADVWDSVNHIIKVTIQNATIAVTGTFWQATQPVSAASLPLPSGAATEATLAANTGALTETAPTTDTASSGLNGRLQRIAQRLSSILLQLPTAPTQFQNLGANVTLNVKSSAGSVLSLYCHNANAADRFIQLHNTATVPSGGAVPKHTFRVPAGGDVLIGSDYFQELGCAFATGIAFAFSTSINTYTAGSAGDQTTTVNYN